jgi:hypothetical protein
MLGIFSTSLQCNRSCKLAQPYSMGSCLLWSVQPTFDQKHRVPKTGRFASKGLIADLSSQYERGQLVEPYLPFPSCRTTLTSHVCHHCVSRVPTHHAMLLSLYVIIRTLVAAFLTCFRNRLLSHVWAHILWRVPSFELQTPCNSIPCLPFHRLASYLPTSTLIVQRGHR